MALRSLEARIRISANAPIFDLPVNVAIDEGLFDRAGLRVAFRQPTVFTGADRTRAFEAREVDAYNLDAWAGVELMARGVRPARITALRPAIVAQAIVSFDDTLQNPHDLAEIEIGVNADTASYYATCQLVAGSLPPEAILVTHLGRPGARYDALVAGRSRVVTLMEPYLSLALASGAHIVAMTFTRGAEVMAAELPDDQIDVYYDVVNDAVDLINGDFDRYKPMLVRELEGRLPPSALSRTFIRYAHAETYDAETAVSISPILQQWKRLSERAPSGRR